MAFLGSQKLNNLISSGNVISPNDGRVVAGAYELGLGGEVFRTDSKDRKKEFFDRANDQVVINPGQFALLLTRETLTIPQDKIAFISIKASIKLKGLVNVSGFHVDPGFQGKLIFSVYNAGSGPISLLIGKPCFLIWFADLELDDDETETYQKESHEHNGQDTIPPVYIDHLMLSEVASPVALNNKINNNQNIVNNKLSLIEKEQTAKDYLVKTALGLGIVILVKFLFDWLSYNNGLEEGIMRRNQIFHLDSTINQLLIEKNNLLKEADSLKSLQNRQSKIGQL